MLCKKQFSFISRSSSASIHTQLSSQSSSLLYMGKATLSGSVFLLLTSNHTIYVKLFFLLYVLICFTQIKKNAEHSELQIIGIKKNNFIFLKRPESYFALLLLQEIHNENLFDHP